VTIPDIDLPLTVEVVPVNRLGPGTPSGPVTMYSEWPPTQPAGSQVCTSLNDMFDNYGNSGTGLDWTGGDGTVSIPLPDGDTAWFFSDTYLGTVDTSVSPPTRPANTPMVHNSVVLQDGDSLTSTILGGTASDPDGVVGEQYDTVPGAWWWVADGLVNGDTLQVFYHEYESDGSSSLSVQMLATGVATFSLPSLSLQSFTVLPSLGSDVDWGAALVQGTDGYTYIYGADPSGGATDLDIARVPNGDILDSSGSTSDWQFWTNSPTVNSGWSDTESDAEPVLSGVGTGFSVKYLNGQYVLVTMDTDLPFSSNIFGYFASSPTGPFENQTLLYTAPEANSSTIVYEARLHPEQSCGGGADSFVVSYNVNTLTPGGNNSDATIYRPRFIDVTLPGAPDTSELPDAPTDLQATTTAGTSTVNLSWDAPVGPNDTDLTYRVYQRDETTGQTQYTPYAATVSGTSVSYDLPNAGTYDYRVTAINSVGEGPPSQMTQVQVTVAAPGSAPTVTAQNEPDGDISLSWTQVSGSGWISYNVYQEDVTAGATSFTPADTTAQDAGSATVTSLKMGDTYEFEVAAYNSGGVGPMSAPVSIVPAVGAPTNLTATANSDGSVTLSWTAPNPGDWYWIYYNNVTANGAEPLSDYTQAIYPITSGTSFTWSGLVGGDTYSFYVTAISNVSSNGDSGPSNTASATLALPGAPTGVTANATNDDAINVSWTAAASGDWYWVLVSQNGGAYTQLPYPDTTTTFDDESLYVGDQYCYEIETISTNGAVSLPSSPACATATLGAPTNLTASPGDGQILLKWNEPLAGQWYWVYERAPGSSTWTQLPYPVTAGTSATIGDLTDGDSYSFYVTTIGPGGGQSLPSNTVTATPVAPTPGIPTGLAATSDANGDITLSWNSVASGDWYWIYENDDTTNPGAVCSRSPTDITFTQLEYPDTTTSFTSTYLTNGDNYSFCVVTIGTDGVDSAPSDVVQAASELAPPTGLTATANDDGSVTLNWTASPGDVSYYWVDEKAPGSSSYTQLPYPLYDTGSSVTFTLTGLTTGSAYSFEVASAGNDGYSSSPSNAVSVTPKLAPPTLSATADNDGNVTLTWTPPFSGAYYWIMYNNDTTNPGDQSDLSDYTRYTAIPASDANDGGLVLGDFIGTDRYSFYLETAYGGNVSGPSNVVDPSRAVPAPTGLSGHTDVDSTGDGSECDRGPTLIGPNCTVTLNWNAISGIGAYNVYELIDSDDQSSYSYLATTDTNSFSFSNYGNAVYGGNGSIGPTNMSGLQASYYVEAVNDDDGSSAPSASTTLVVGNYSGSEYGACYAVASTPWEGGGNAISDGDLYCPPSESPADAIIYTNVVTNGTPDSEAVNGCFLFTTCSVQATSPLLSGTNTYATQVNASIPTTTCGYCAFVFDPFSEPASISN
jgi:fibronectin type 3 domain-containing protein